MILTMFEKLTSGSSLCEPNHHYSYLNERRLNDRTGMAHLKNSTIIHLTAKGGGLVCGMTWKSGGAYK